MLSDSKPPELNTAPYPNYRVRPEGSGGDLRTAKADGFASLYLEKVRAMKPLYLNDPEHGPKTEVEDRMYPMYSHCVFNLNPRACSIPPSR